jgi:hypothetical protein
VAIAMAFSQNILLSQMLKKYVHYNFNYNIVLSLGNPILLLGVLRNYELSLNVIFNAKLIKWSR